MKALLHKRLWGIRLIEYLFVGIFYLFFAIGYHLTLWINTRGYGDGPGAFFDFINFMDASGLNHLVKLLLTIPIWWFIFRRLKHVPIRYRLLAHLVGLPLFVFSFQRIYYWLAESVGFAHLQGAGQVWDIYIPAMFYILQFGILHTYEYYHDNQQHLKLKAALTEAALKSELSALKAQLNPHFLYNVFNTISASLPPEQERTREMIAQLSDLLRYQLKASNSEVVPLREELAFVESYLQLERARFGDRLRVQIDVPEALRNQLVPPMILQPLVENSIKHGISSLIEGGEISIRIRQKNGRELAFEIADTGVGIKDKTRIFNVGLGLTNTKLRLEKKYGSTMTVSDNAPRGVKVEFAI